MMLNAALTVCALAVPPTSKKLAGSPPLNFIISGYYAATVTNTASDTNIKSELLAALNLGLASVQESRGSQSEIEQALNIKQIRAAIERLNKLEGK